MASMRSGRSRLVEAAEQFERWRRGRRRGALIPDGLWEAAVAVAREEGVSRTALSLRLDYYALKRRLEESGAAGGAEFVEVPLETVLGSGPPPECELELEDASGKRLRVVLKGAATSGAEAVARALWSERR
jgi:hypothetical protein